jgi:DNA-nicking Smr family endonuclease
MARKKRKKGAQSIKKSPVMEPEAFNPAFTSLDNMVKEQQKAVENRREKTPVDLPPVPNDDQDFISAMSDVKPVAQGKRTVTRSPNPELRPAHTARNDESEGLAHLADLVSGAADMDISFTDEYIEGAVHGLSRQLLERLKKGRFPVQDYVDLHGLTQQEAEVRVRDFLIKSHRLGLRCVLIIHGRGLNSQNHIPVLKERLPVWLSRGPVRKIVLAFSTAKPYDGGTGAIYILLRMKRGLV